MTRTALACTAFLLLTACAMNPQITPAVRSELAPSGKLRVAINHSNFLLVNPGSPEVPGLVTGSATSSSI